MSDAGAVSAGKPSVKRAEALNLRIQEIAAPILQSHGLELVEAVCVGQGPRTVIRVFIDKPGGITLTDCEQAHRSLSPALDVIDPFPHARRKQPHRSEPLSPASPRQREPNRHPRHCCGMPPESRAVSVQESAPDFPSPAALLVRTRAYSTAQLHPLK